MIAAVTIWPGDEVAGIHRTYINPNGSGKAGVDPDKWQGFAFGLGIDRVALLKYGVPDLRSFFDADVRWLGHYGFAPLDLPTLVGGIA